MLTRWAASPMDPTGMCPWDEGDWIKQSDIPPAILAALDAGHGEALARFASDYLTNKATCAAFLEAHKEAPR